MDVVSSSLNLAKVILEFPSTSALVPIWKAANTWLVLKNVDKGLFHQFCEKAHNLAHPNQHGVVIFSNIREADFKDVPDLIKASFSLGRYVGRDPGLAYLVTTVATLIRYHDIDQITGILFSMLVDQGGHENKVSEHRWHYYDDALKSVLAKVVDSIYFSVCNVSNENTLPGLPKPLADLDSRTLMSMTFAAITRSIESHNEDVVIRSEHFFKDLFLWLYYHFHGTVKVVKGNEVIFDESRSEIKRTLTMMLVNLPKACPHGEQRRTIEVSIATGVLPQPYRTYVKDYSQPISRSQSYLRQPFYELTELVRGPQRMRTVTLYDDDLLSIKLNAARIIDWLLKLRICLLAESRVLTFTVDSQGDQNQTDEWLVLGDLFPCTPYLLHEVSHRTRWDLPIFMPWSSSGYPQQCSVHEDVSSIDHRQSKLTHLLAWFPPLNSMVQDVQKRCPCPACREGKGLDDCKPGCLRDEAVTRLLLLLAHGITDAMGGIDVSGFDGGSGGTDSVLEEQRQTMLGLLYNIIEKKYLAWDEVFPLVSSVISGSYISDVFHEVVDDSSSWVAFQHGALVIMPRWLDLKKRRKLDDVFALRIIPGATIHGVLSETAVVRSEGRTTDVNHMVSDENENTVTRAEEVSALVREHDSIQRELETAIFSISGPIYRLLTIVKAGKFQRNVDVTLALLGYLSSRGSRPTCDHPGAEQPFDLDDQRLAITDFDRALGLWGFCTPENTIQLTKTLDDPLKINVVFSASPECSVVREVDLCCLSCALAYLRENDFRTSDDMGTWTEECLRIISVARCRDRDPGPKRRRLEHPDEGYRKRQTLS